MVRTRSQATEKSTVKNDEAGASCPSCDLDVSTEDQAIQCAECNLWFHRKCLDEEPGSFTEQMYDFLMEDDENFYKICCKGENCGNDISVAEQLADQEVSLQTLKFLKVPANILTGISEILDRRKQLERKQQADEFAADKQAALDAAAISVRKERWTLPIASRSIFPSNTASRRHQRS